MPGLFDTDPGSGGGLLSGLADRFNRAAVAAGNPTAYYQQQQQQQMQQGLYHAGITAGAPEPIARAAALTGKIELLQPYLDQAPKVQATPPDPFGHQGYVSIRGGANPSVQELPVQPAAGGTGMQNNGFLATGIPQVNPGLQGNDYLAQFRPEIQAAVKAYMAGDVMPTGNPRSKGIADMAKTIAQKIGPELGVEVSDTAYQAKRKLRVDLASSSPNSMGGILSNGASAFEHLATVADKFAALRNYTGPNIPGGGVVGRVGNALTNEYLPSPQTQANLAATRDPLLKYGQESTKFYAGTGGSEGERTDPSKAIDPKTTSPLEQAAFLDSAKELMLKRFHEKEVQITRELGPEYLLRHPIVTPEMKQTIAHIDRRIAELRGGQSPSIQSGPTPQSPPPGKYKWDPQKGLYQ